MRLIGDSPLLFKIIDLMGHMRPAAALACRLGEVDLATPLGLGAAIDPCGKALLAFERFGYGYLEVGPVNGVSSGRPRSEVRYAERGVDAPKQPVGIDAVLTNLARAKSRLGTKRFVRIAAGGDTERVMRRLAPHVDAFLVPRELAEHAGRSGKPWGVLCPLADVARLTDAAGAAFVVIDADGASYVPSDLRRGVEAVSALKLRFPETQLVYAAGGVESPADALALRQAGATAISLSHGFLFTGPGTPKRINAAFEIGATTATPEANPETLLQCARFAWFWCVLQGLAMIVGALLATYFALTLVILPYDEAASGITRDAILRLNPKVLKFMAHDRFTLAGTMLSLGLLYTSLGWNGVRRGRAWAQEAVVYSAFTGFLTFFAFIGYGYFDQFHAFVAAALLPIAVQCAASQVLPAAPLARSDLVNDRAWRWSAVGQLCFVVEAIGLILAGLVIMLVGARYVFVATDLAFLGTTGEAMTSVYPRLVPLIAHDRATFGGMLLSSGIAVLLTTLWGFARGERWIWRTFLLAGYLAYAATLWIHASIAYTDPLHLSPVFIGLFLHTAGLALTSGFLRKNGP
jgi:dihydroorotate dehydrogenase